MLRVSTAAQSGVRPYQSVTLTSRAALDQEARDVHVVVGDGHQERRDAVGVGALDVGAGGDQRPRRIQPAVARGVQQRRQRAGNQIPRPALGQPAADDPDAVSETGHRIGQHPRRRLPGARLRVHVGAALHEQLHDRRTVFADGDHQRRLLKGRVLRVDDGAAVEEEFDGVDLAHTRRGHERGFAGRIGVVRIRADFEQHANHLRVAVGGREVQRRDAVAVRAGGIGAGTDQQPRSLDIVDANKPVKGGRAVPARRVDVGFLIDQRAHGGRIALHGRLGEAGVVSPRGRLYGPDWGGRLRGRGRRLRSHGGGGRLGQREQRDQGGRGEPQVVPHGSTSLSPDEPRSQPPGRASAAKKAQNPALRRP